jgi:ankyrin repeat protein
MKKTPIDLSCEDELGNTALHLACWQGHEACSLLILDHSSRDLINKQNKEGKSPLHIAARNGLVTVVKELLRQGASCDLIDTEGYTPALSCAPDQRVADCLCSILTHMLKRRDDPDSDFIGDT